MEAVVDCVQPEIEKRHEGVAYLLGMSDGRTTVALAAVRPEARTTRGSFDVTAVAMAKVVRSANTVGLQVVGQLHTHPGQAYHSDGDEQGAHIAYSGFASVVIPTYGDGLPSLDGAAAYIYRAPAGFEPLPPANITVVSGMMP